MLDLFRHWVAFKFDRRGVTAVEYALIAGVLGAILVTAFTNFGANITTAMSNIGGKL